jgi:lysophospholipase L1-like esterase
MTTKSIRHFRSLGLLVAVGVAAPLWVTAAVWLETKPADPFFEKFTVVKAPPPGKLMLRAGDRLAIVGDSITEQKMYSRIMETYLTVCVPELRISTRQFGWTGEVAESFLRRMTNDCLRFRPTVATTCYGMNDYQYRPYDLHNALWYSNKYTAVVEAFKAAGTRVILGSPGCVGKVASWVKNAFGTLEEHNLHLCALRNIDIEIAAKGKIRFADVFWPMFKGGFEARKEYGTNYVLTGDGVHPRWAGHLVMAYAFLHAMGFDGNIGTFTVNLKTQSARVTEGHTLDHAANGEFTITSRRYPFCATGQTNNDNSIRSGMTLVPFNQELNRLMLVAKGGSAANYKVTWGKVSRVYSAAQLAKGVNLADGFAENPFSEAFKKVDEAVAAKQAYETRQIKNAFHSPEAKADMVATVARTEAERAPLAKAIEDAFVPVTHTLKVEPL